jgi:hypothetical protein
LFCLNISLFYYFFSLFYFQKTKKKKGEFFVSPFCMCVFVFPYFVVGRIWRAAVFGLLIVSHPFTQPPGHDITSMKFPGHCPAFAYCFN